MPPSTRVAYQGEPGAYSEAAAHEAFKPTGLTIDAIGHASFEEVFKSLVDGNADYAAVPVENTLGGSIHVNYDLMLRNHDVHVIGEHSFRVRHCMLALPGVKKADVKHAMSHPQALAQTEQYLRAAGIVANPAYDTAGSAKIVREKGLRDTVAIASARAAEVHGLEVLDYGIEDDTNNFTRFLILSRTPVQLPENTPAKTSVVFIPQRNEVGVLHKALSCFAQRDIDLSKIESRPFRGGDVGLGAALLAEEPAPSEPAAKRARMSKENVGGGGVPPAGAGAIPQFEYAFYVDALVKLEAPKCRNALRHLEELTRYCKVLGTYPRDGICLPPAREPSHASVPGTPGGGTAAGSAVGRVGFARAESLVSPLRIGIIGFGTFGQFLARRFRRRGHEIWAQSRSDYSELAESMGVTYVKTADDLAKVGVDVLLISVSILSFGSVLRALPAKLLEGVLVADMLSVKQYAKTTMMEALPASADIMCMHPMFGPESGRNSWQGLPCVFEHTRVRDFHRAARLLSLFEDEGCRMVRMACDEHDALAASSQFVTHLTGRLLSKLNLKPSPIATTGFKALLKLVDNTCADSFDLFYALYAHNPDAEVELREFTDALDALRGDLLAVKGGGSASSAGSGGGGGGGGAPSMEISRLITAMPMSATTVVFGKAAELKRQGKPLVTLSVGEPDILPAQSVMRAAHDALDAGHVKYTETQGIHALREAICTYLQAAKGLTYTPGQIVCSSGGKQSLLQAMLALLNPGDEVIVPAPYWVSYTAMAKMCGATPVTIHMREEDGYCLMPRDLAAAITPKTRLLILCNPSNPTGAVMPRPLLEEIAGVLRQHPRVAVIADEIYEQITFDEPHVAFAALPGMYERTVTLNGFSKGPAMTGMRLGYIAAPQALATACIKVQSQNTSSPVAISQYAAIAALTADDIPKWLAEANAGYRKKRDYTLQRLRAMPGVSHAYEPQGAFYAFPTISSLFGKTTPAGKVLEDAAGVCLYLIEECLVALVPGEAFGNPNCLRISYAASLEQIGTAMDRMEAGIKALK